ncbi:hypothetical protein CEQ28_013885 [Hafnia alvei]|nr:hypothetical protein CEQ28_013885 [Hafnia alvei]
MGGGGDFGAEVEAQPQSSLSTEFPDINYFLHRPFIEDVGRDLCSLKELQDGTYSINDLATFHDIMDLRNKLKPKEVE